MKLSFDATRLLKITATGCAGLFAGAAFYINAADQPARMTLDVASCRRHWIEVYNRAKWFQGAMCMAGSLSGAAVYYLESEAENRALWLAGAGVFVLVFPFTIFVMGPDIKKNLKEDVLETAGETWVLNHIKRWNKQHMFRTAFGLLAFDLFLLALAN
ncbi:uncharacterized protein LOC127839190 isoform X2 [Dreissena polymorpha]|uniref:DUF1772 domain-containing protein n=1 Tax=Dreissena polymorpha TaxID=45954 RepID=A0A9D4FGM0_DREPO|nr:uncharacterized protein LOC127839190 isoform X2 [Dreissena polymorpha]KAH3796948.1 hypothetical protein DPMN_150524 [Dreissena polymorpha]